MVSITRSLWMAVVLAIGLLMGGGGGAYAHSELVSSTPTDGEALASVPSTVTLQFNEAISPAGLQVVAQGPQGPLTLGTPVIEGATVQVPWPGDAPGGDYRVAYRVVSADGHPIDGSLGFSYPQAAVTAPIEPADLGQSAVATQDLSAPASDQPSSDGFPWWLGVGAVIVGVGIGAAIARTMRARAQAANSNSPQ